MISREANLPIDRTKLSKAIKIEASKITLRTSEDFVKLSIDVTLDTVPALLTTASYGG